MHINPLWAWIIIDILFCIRCLFISLSLSVSSLPLILLLVCMLFHYSFILSLLFCFVLFYSFFLAFQVWLCHKIWNWNPSALNHIASFRFVCVSKMMCKNVLASNKKKIVPRRVSCDSHSDSITTFFSVLDVLLPLNRIECLLHETKQRNVAHKLRSIQRRMIHKHARTSMTMRGPRVTNRRISQISMNRSRWPKSKQQHKSEEKKVYRPSNDTHA